MIKKYKSQKLLCNIFSLVLGLSIPTMIISVFTTYAFSSFSEENPLFMMVSICIFMISLGLIIASGVVRKITHNYLYRHCENCGELFDGAAWQYKEIKRDIGHRHIKSKFFVEVECPHCQYVNTSTLKIKEKSLVNIENKVEAKISSRYLN